MTAIRSARCRLKQLLMINPGYRRRLLPAPCCLHYDVSRPAPSRKGGPNAMPITRRASDDALDLLFREARTYRSWKPEPVSTELLRQVYELAKWGPTANNACPMRIVFLHGEAAVARLLPALSSGNVEKSRTAAAVAIVAYDTEFFEKLPVLSPHGDVRASFAGKPEYIKETAFRNGSLQGAYFMLAARALGLDCGPMSGFDTEKVNAEFFPDGKWRVNFVCNLGYGDPSDLRPRAPRLDFDEACVVLE
jgi:3-hydroxypropanoate dehydrogenase